eukprot:319503-Ditylum_brightwellii.AAC.1
MSKLGESKRIETTMQNMLERGNHKSAKGENNKKTLERSPREDTEMDLSLLLLPEVATSIVRGRSTPWAYIAKHLSRKK